MIVLACKTPSCQCYQPNFKLILFFKNCNTLVFWNFISSNYNNHSEVQNTELQTANIIPS